MTNCSQNANLESMLEHINEENKANHDGAYKEICKKNNKASADSTNSSINVTKKIHNHFVKVNMLVLHVVAKKVVAIIQYLI
ncbi:MAG: hypothetical protein HUJ51_05805 [Eggerthellaceae bacterium]|nr:hypothetical protein [Eggerthellaceae bacterium]